jgi:hypothetical protein
MRAAAKGKIFLTHAVHGAVAPVEKMDAIKAGLISA